MKVKCDICSQGKGQRACVLKNNALICPPCCAAMRSEACQGCSYYTASAKYQIVKAVNKSEAGDYLWHKLRRTEGWLVPVLMKYAIQRFGPAVIADAWDEFMCWPEELPKPNDCDEFETIFTPWFLFNWVPEQPKRKSKKKPLPEKQIALCYRDEHPESLDDFQIRFIEAACAQPYSFCVIADIVSDQALVLRDLFLGSTCVVKERNAAKPDYKGIVLFTRILTIDDTSIMLGAAQLPIPAAYQNWLIDRREEYRKTWGRLSSDFLFEYDIELRDLYWYIKKQLSKPPELHNTDGDLFEMHRLHYELLCPIREAFDRLKPLRLDSSDENFLADAVYGKDGEMEKLSFDWLKKNNKKHAEWDNTLMGIFKITREGFSVEVNSAQRAKKIKGLITNLLGPEAVYKNEVIESAEALFEKAKKESPEKKAASARKQQEIKENPEVQAMMREMAEKHWASWINQKIPALGDVTPRQAAKTKLGREKLEALFLDFESRSALKSPDPFIPDIAKLRSMLKM